MLPFLEGLLGFAKPPVTPGSANYTSPGTYYLIIPNYNTLTVEVRGAGGESCGNFTGGANGGYSSFNGTVVAYGGAGGIYDAESNPVNGAHGTAVGGDSNITGGGSPGGVLAGYDPDGGYGGRSVKTYAEGALTPGVQVTIVVGAAGNVSTSWPDGGHGAVYISWN